MARPYDEPADSFSRSWIASYAQSSNPPQVKGCKKFPG
jgi:hypothetical protein